MGGTVGHGYALRLGAAIGVFALVSGACGPGSTPPGQFATAAAVGGPAPAGYLLPAAAGTDLVVTNGPHGSGDHAAGQYGEYAYDFGAPGDAPFTVVASRGGTVLAVQRDSTTQCQDLDHDIDGTADKGCWLKANHVLIDHRDGTAMLYMHFAPNTISVNPGDPVCAGTPLGTDGKTGWATAPHLHMQLEKTPTPSSSPGWWFPQSIDGLVFTDPVVLAKQADGRPLALQSFVSSTKPTCDVLGASTGPSASPPSAAPSPFTPVPILITPAPIPTVAPQPGAGGALGEICQPMQWGEPAYLALTSRFGPIDFDRSIQPTLNHYEWYFTNGTPSAQDVRGVLTSLRLTAHVKIGSDGGGNQFVIIDLGNGGCPAS